MTRLAHPRIPAEALLTRPAAVSARYPAPSLELSATAQAALRTVRPLPGIAAQVLFDLRADDARDTSFAAARALLRTPMHDPAEDSQPIAALLDRAEHVRRSRDAACRALFDEDRRRREDLQGAAWIDAAVGAEMNASVRAVLDAVAARPELRHDTALLMALAPVVALLKGSVA